MAHLFVSYYLKGIQSFMGRENLVVELLGIMSLFAVKCQQTPQNRSFFNPGVTDHEISRGVMDREISRSVRRTDREITRV